jgi:glutaryl-CoA dehydrogenase (non-decarboxylating)
MTRMHEQLTETQRSLRAEFRQFAQEVALPQAAVADSIGRLSGKVTDSLRKTGYLGALTPCEFGGLGLDNIAFGLLSEEVGRACSSIRSLITAHAMVALSVERWSCQQHRETWLPRLASGSVIAGFGLSEANAGSDINGIETTASRRGGKFVLNGCKRWVTGGEIADVFLVFARCDEGPAAFLIERNRDGLKVVPAQSSLGVRASMVAHIELTECDVSAECMVGRAGFGLSAVAASALDVGRYSIAWGCLGIIECALEACIRHVGTRRQFGTILGEQQLVQRMIAKMITSARATRLLCYDAGRLREARDSASTSATCIAKYFASTRCAEAARDAVQLHGAVGCCDGHIVQRIFRDSKIMEIIEGSTEIQQILIGGLARVEPAVWNPDR